MVDPINMLDAEEHVIKLLDALDTEGAADFLRELHPADSAELLVELTSDQQADIVSRFDAGELADLFEQMDEDEVVEVAQHLELETLADVLDEMAPDEAADVLGEMQPEAAAEILEEMDESDPVVSLLAYDEESAGGIMNHPPACLRRQMTVAQAITFLKQHYRTEDELHYLYVLDRFGHLIGVVSLRALVLAEMEQSIEEIMSRDVISIRVDMDQEEVAQLLARYNFLALPVVDANEHLVGIVSVDDVVDVIEEEATEDIYRLAQVSSESEIFRSGLSRHAKPIALALCKYGGRLLLAGFGRCLLSGDHCRSGHVGRVHAHCGCAGRQCRQPKHDDRGSLACSG
ncbi:MAG: magnesium transporter [Caldilineaceae bacterium]|nr:magnesium transporter [Caldilineaceae bacterium]